MAEKRTIELEIQDNSKSLKAQYREAVQELQKVSAQYGETSKEAVKAAKAAADLKDQIAFSKDLVDAFNPDAKFKAVEGAVNGALNGFQAFEGGLALIGVESEDLQKTMVKLQAVMALTQGINGIMEAKDSFKQLGTVVSSAFTSMTTAGKAFAITGIGLVITAIALAADSMGAFSDKSKEQELAEKNLERQTKSLEKTIESYNNTTNQTIQTIDNATRSELALARQRGASQAELTKITKAGVQDRLNVYKNETDALRKIYLQQSKTGTIEQFAKAEKAYLDSVQKVNDAKIQLQEIDADIAEQQRSAAASQLNAAKSNTKEIIDLRKQIQDEQIKAIKDEDERAQIQLIVEAERRIEEIKKTVADKKQKAQLIKEIENNLIVDLDKLDLEYFKKQQEKIDAEKKILQDQAEWIKNYKKELEEEERQRNIKEYEKSISFEKKQQQAELLSLKGTDKEKLQNKFAFWDELDNLNQLKQEGAFKSQEDYEKAVDVLKDKYAKIDLERKRKQQDLIIKGIKDSLQIASDLTQLFAGKSEAQQKKAFMIQKGINIANATVDTYKAATSALRDYPSPFNYIAMAAAITAGLLNIKKIKETQFGTGGGGGGNNAPVGANAPAPMTANFSTIGSSGINQLATLQQKPTQAYVVSGEVTSAQALDRNRVQNATL